jgi:hypothetical protein
MQPEFQSCCRARKNAHGIVSASIYIQFWVISDKKAMFVVEPRQPRCGGAVNKRSLFSNISRFWLETHLIQFCEFRLSASIVGFLFGNSIQRLCHPCLTGHGIGNQKR